jgi:hypothetical protein
MAKVSALSGLSKRAANTQLSFLSVPQASPPAFSAHLVGSRIMDFWFGEHFSLASPVPGARTDKKQTMQAGTPAVLFSQDTHGQDIASVLKTRRKLPRFP